MDDPQPTKPDPTINPTQPNPKLITRVDFTQALLRIALTLMAILESKTFWVTFFSSSGVYLETGDIRVFVVGFIIYGLKNISADFGKSRAKIVADQKRSFSQMLAKRPQT